MKYFLYWGAVCCAVGQLLLALYARFYGDIAAEIQAADLVPNESEFAIVKALNYALPVGVACIGLLIYTWKIDRVGGIAFCFAIGLQAVAMDLNLRAVRHVFGEKVALDKVAWWYPTPETLAKLGGG